MSESIRAVERALDVLLCFSQDTPELSMTQIAAMIKINKSTVHRLLGTLEKKRFVQRDAVTGIYEPGIRLLQMAYLTLQQNNLRRLALPIMRRLCEKHHENVNLAVLDDIDVVYVDVVESPLHVKLAASAGQRLPAFCTASGKAILAFLPEDKVKEILKKGVKSYTQNTIISQEKYFESMRKSREQGFALSEQEFEDGIDAVAAPILDQHGLPIGSLSIAGPAFRLTRERMMEFGPDVQAAGKELARDLLMAGAMQENPNNNTL
jgi:IclR family acetate operon transcriptional repressor